MKKSAATPADAAGGPELAWGVCGIGVESAMWVAAWLEKEHFDRVVLAGFAGGLDPAIGGGEIFRWEIGETWPAEVWCAPVVITTPAAKQAAFAERGVRLVEMEGEPIWRVTQAHGVPLTMVRIVSDTAHEVFPEAMMASYDMARQRPSLWGFLGGLLRRPWAIPGVIALLRRWTTYRTELAEHLFKMRQRGDF